MSCQVKVSHAVWVVALCVEVLIVRCRVSVLGQLSLLM